MRLSSADSGVIGSSGSASESTCSSSMRSSSPPSLTRSSATTVPVTVTADSAVSADTDSLSSLEGSRLSSTVWARPVSSRTIRNCMRFWSRRALTQPRMVTRSETWSASSAIGVRVTAGTLAVPCSGRLFRQLHLDRERFRLARLELLDHACAAQVIGAQLQRRQAVGTVAHDHPCHGRAHFPARVRLGLADLPEHFGSGGQRVLLARGRAVRRTGRDGAADARRLRPGSTMNRALLPPRPDLLGDEGQKRREQTLEHGQRCAQGEADRCPGAVGGVIAARLDELEVVVAVPPEEGLAALERASVVVIL